MTTRTTERTAPPKRRKGHGEGTITERRQLPDGRWLIRWRIRGTTPSGTYERRSGTTRGTLADARREMSEARADIEKTTPTSQKDMTVTELVQDFLAERGPHLRPRTRETYTSHLRLHITPHLGAVKVRGLDAGTLQRFHRKLAAETKLGRTRQLIHGVLSQALDHAVVLGVTDHNPARAVRVPPPPPPRRLRMEDDGQVMAFTPELADRLHRLALEDGTPHGFAVALALGLGLRRGEVYGLRTQDLDLTARPDAPYGLLHVRQTLTTSGAEDRISPPKTRRSRRTLRLNEKARAALDAALAWQKAHAASPDWAPSGLVFTTPTGAAERPNRSRDRLNALQRQMWAEIRREAGPETANEPDPELLPFHSLRATFVSCAHAAGASIEDISRVCGHVSVFVTETIYRRVFDRAAPLVRYAQPPGGGEELKAELARHAEEKD